MVLAWGVVGARSAVTPMTKPLEEPMEATGRLMNFWQKGRPHS